MPRKAGPRAAPRRSASGGRSGSDRSQPGSAKRLPAAFPIVGIGASAGGLEALEQFLSRVPVRSGMAFAVVQHLDPTRKGIMPELLQRSTPMQVVQAGDGMAMEPNRVYVIPPNKDMSLKDGILYLFEPAAPRGLRLPIDFFFRSMAIDRQHLAIGVILSGMGSDGTLGLRAIRENAGLTLVQDPASAKFDGMPRSAIDAGVADVVAAAEELPDRIVACLHHAPVRDQAPGEEVSAAPQSLDKIIVLLRLQTGNDFSLYKKSTLLRRIERRMGIHQIDRIADYVRFLSENATEVDLLFKELLIGVTSFFRDPEAWELLRDQALPRLFAASPDGRTLRAWVTGCSTGEEAYSLAIVFREALEQLKPQGRFSLQIYATDLDQAAIDKARQGHFPSNIAADVSQQRLARYFVADETGYSVGKEVRELVIFAPQNVIMDPPFTKLDMLCCRNLLIYLGAELQKKLLPLFHYSLNPGGILFLGSAETIGNLTDLFAPVDSKARLYQRSASKFRLGDVEFPTKLFPANAVAAPGETSAAPPLANLQVQADQLLLRNFSPPAVFINAGGDIVYINGRTGRYLEPAAGKANLNIYAMARGGLGHELSSAVQRARLEGRATIGSVQLEENGRPACVSVLVEALQQPSGLAGMFVVVFHDLPPPAKRPRQRRGKSTDAMEMEAEAQRLREQLQTTRDEMQSSQEELKSANEELQSTNEELQSTNEELTTSKEEMQSLNEELQTVNAELQSKVEDLSRASNDMKNLLNSTDIATVFLDGALRVRRFTHSATRIIKLIPGDVGRPLSDIASDLNYPALQQDAAEVLRSLNFSEKEICARDGRWFDVRIMPYRTTDNVIDGVVLTFVDVTRAKMLEGQLRAASGSRSGQAPSAADR
jgi:two-component system CheB/CheR fusion protein